MPQKHSFFSVNTKCFITCTEIFCFCFHYWTWESSVKNWFPTPVFSAGWALYAKARALQSSPSRLSPDFRRMFPNVISHSSSSKNTQMFDLSPNNILPKPPKRKWSWQCNLSGVEIAKVFQHWKRFDEYLSISDPIWMLFRSKISIFKSIWAQFKLYRVIYFEWILGSFLSIFDWVYLGPILNWFKSIFLPFLLYKLFHTSALSVFPELL